MMRRWIAMACVWVFASTAAVMADDPVLIRFSHVVAEDTPKGIGARLFKERAEARFPGRVQVEIYPRSRKFTDEEVLVALLFGDVDMAAPSFTLFRSFSPVFQLYELPFLFDDIDHLHRFQDSAVGQQMLTAMQDRGIRGLAFWDSGLRVLSASEPVVVPADARGLLFRIEPSAVFLEQYRRIGAVAIQMPFRRVTDAIRDGLVEGQENSWSNIYSRGIHRLHTHFTELDHTFLGYMVITNDAFWAGLPDDIRPALEEIIAEVTLEVRDIAARKATEDREKAIHEGGLSIIRPNDDERALWREAWLPIWKDFEDAIGTDVIDAALALDAAGATPASGDATTPAR